MGKLSPAVHYRCYIELTGLRSSEFVGNIVGGMRRVPFAPGKQWCRVLDAPGRCSVERQKTHPGISRICMAVASGQEDCHDSSLCPIHFDTRVDKWISVLPSFETPTCIIYKFSTVVFNQVVR